MRRDGYSIVCVFVTHFATGHDCLWHSIDGWMDGWRFRLVTAVAVDLKVNCYLDVVEVVAVAFVKWSCCCNFIAIHSVIDSILKFIV